MRRRREGEAERRRRAYERRVAGRSGEMRLLVECKSPNVLITQAAIKQAGIYQKTLGIEMIFITNGLVHVFMKLNSETGNFEFIPELPHYADLT